MMQKLQLRSKRALRRSLHGIPTWSNINRIGQSRVVSWSILIPFLGSVIVFNQHLVDLLTVAPEALGASQEATREFTLKRLYYLYFGLSFLGIASFLFILLCPKDIKEYGNARAYIDSERPLMSHVRVQLVLRQIANDFLRHRLESTTQAGIYAADHGILRILAYPSSLQALFVGLANRVFPQMGAAFADGFPPKSIGRSARNFETLGGVNMFEFSRMLREDVPGDRAIAEKFTELASDNVSDILTIRYLALDQSRPVLRALLALFYGLGFLILFIPTLLTFFAILGRLVGI